MSTIRSKAKASSKIPRAPPPKQPSTGFKSTEFVDETDDSQEASASTSLQKASSIQSKKITTENSKPTAPMKTTNSTKQNIPYRTKSSSSTSEAETDDSEDEEDDDGEYESSSESGSSSAKEHATKTRLSATSPRPSSREDVAKSLYKVQPVNGVKRKAGEEQQSKERNDEEESGSGSEEEDSTEDESGTSSGSDEVTAAHALQANAPAQHDQSPRVAAKQYKPPLDFRPATISVVPSSKAADLLKPSNLEGKQIWHITAPAPLPINSIREVSAQSLQDGSPIFSQRGTDYGLVPQTTEIGEVLLLPSVEENRYQISRAQLSNTLHIRQVVQLPKIATNPNGPADAANEPDALRHRQPPGLKMRFHPFGVSSDSDPEADSQEERSATRFRPPPTMEKISPTKKRKHKEAPSSQSVEPSPSKSKKQKTLPAESIDVDGLNAMEIDSPVTKQKSPEKRFKSEHSKPNGTQPTAATPNGKETPEQRAKRKEEKRRQKALQQQQPSSATVDEKELPTPKLPKPKSSKVPKMPLAEFSARLSAEEARATQRAKSSSSQLLTPGQSSPTHDRESKTEKARRKEEKKRRRAQLATDG